MADPTLPDRLRRLAVALERSHDPVGAMTAREAAGVLELIASETDGPVRPPLTETPWPDCLEPGCTVRVDPWDHNTRCSEHRPPDDPAPAIVRHVKVPQL